MNSYIEKYKGIHPGILLARELNRRSIKQRPFALSIHEHPQTINAITKANRNINTALALKIDDELGFEKGTFALLQTYYDIKIEKGRTQRKPDLSKIRKVLFWDTDFDNINWEEKYKAVIRRIFERGNELEKEVITQFYGEEKVERALSTDNRQSYLIHQA